MNSAYLLSGRMVHNGRLEPKIVNALSALYHDFGTGR